MTSKITEFDVVEAGADALRQRLQSGKKLRPWSDLPNSVKKKWREYATVVLVAAGQLDKITA